MSIYPKYLDGLTHAMFGKSKLPLFIVEKQINSYPLHHHNFAELSLVTQGTGTEIVNGKPHRFSRGTVTFLLPHHIHEIIVDEPYVRKFNCMFELSLLFHDPIDHEIGTHFLKTGNELPSHYDLDEEQSRYMIKLFETLKLEYENDRFAKETVIRSKLFEIFVYLTRTLQPKENTKFISKTGVGQHRVQELLKYLHMHYQENITLTHICNHFNWNISYISRVFKQHVGQSFKDYFNSLRVSRATSLLASTTMSIMDISVEVGFEHAGTMTRVFKERMGMTPRDYRNLRNLIKKSGAD